MGFASRSKQKLSKGQINKEVRRILLQFQVSLSDLTFTTSIKSIYLLGSLLKNNGNDFKTEELTLLVNELENYGNIRSDLDNWYISRDSIHYTGRTNSNNSDGSAA